MMTVPTFEPPGILKWRVGERAVALLIGFAALLLTGPFIYQNGLGEPDSTAMAVGIFQAKVSGQGLAEPFLYAPETQPLYYLLLLALAGRGWPYDAIVQLMNLLSWVANALNLALIYLLARRLCGSEGAILVAVTLSSAPIFIDLSTYGHPLSLATCLLLAAVVALLPPQQPLPGESCIVPWRTLAVVWGLLTSSLLLRIDGAFLLPGLLALVWYVGGRRLAFVTAGLMLSAALAFAGTHRLLASSGYSSGIFDLYLRLMTPDSHFFQRLLYAMPPMVAACGVGTLSLVLWACAASTARGLKAGLWVSICFLAPCLFRGFVAPVPMRHFYSLLLGAAFILGIFFSDSRRSLTPKRLLAQVAAIVLLNLGLVVFLEQMSSSNSPGSGVHHRLQPVLTSVFARHRGNEEYQQWDEARWQHLLQGSTRNALFVGTWCDLVGLRQGVARSGRYLEVITDQRWTDSRLVTFRNQYVSIRFVEYYGFTGFRLPRLSEPVQYLVLLADYETTDFQGLSWMKYDVPPPSVWRF